jgi:transcriptional regulatory protein LevR
MKQSVYMSRRTDADHLAALTVDAIKARAVSKFNCQEDHEVMAFTTGYLSSLLAQVAAQSPAGLRELQSAVDYLGATK